MTQEAVTLLEAWRDPKARGFFRNVWPLYVHEISGFDTDFYRLDESGRFVPDLVEDWISPVTPAVSLRAARSEGDPSGPFQRAYVIALDGRPVGFVCVGVAPFAYMPEDADVSIAEFFVIHEVRGSETASRALRLLFERFSGSFQLSVIHDNARALRFWRRALPSLSVRDLEERRVEGDIEFRFIVGRASPSGAA